MVMHVPAYLTTSRHNILYFRWPIPKSSHPQNKASDIKLSLATRDFNEALQLSRLLAYFVRRHIKWITWRPDLREDLAHLVQDIKRRVCGIASAAAPWFSV